MADSNYVEILVRARDQAKPDLDDLRAKLEELDKTVADARVKVDDKGDAAKLDRMAARLDELGRKTASPRIRLAGALRAEAEVHAIEASLDNMQRKAAQSGARGVIGTFLNGTEGAGIGGPLGIAAFAGAFTFLAEQIAAVLGPLAAAGAGLAAFGALAVPALLRVKNAYTGISAAQKSYSAAVALDKLDPTKAHAAAAAAALDKLRLAWQGMSPVTRDAVKGLQGIAAEFSGLAQRIAPMVLRVFDALLPGIKQLIGDMGPFAAAIGPVLEKMAASFSKFTMSAGFRDFLNSLLRISPAAVAAIGEGIGKIAIAIGKFLEASARGGGLKNLARDFGIVAAAIRTVGPALVKMASTSASRIADVIRWARDLVHWTKDLWHWWQDAWNFMTSRMRSAASAIGGQIQVVIGWIKSAGSFVTRVYGTDIPHWIGVAVRSFTSMPGKILHAVGGFGKLLYSSGQALLQGLLSGIESMIGSVVKAAESVGSSILRSIKGALGIGSPSREGIAIGVNIGDSIIAGMTSRLGRVAGAASQMGRAALPPHHAAAGSGGGHGHPIIIEFAPAAGTHGSELEALFWTWLRRSVRTRGGRGANSVQIALGQGR